MSSLQKLKEKNYSNGFMRFIISFVGIPLTAVILFIPYANFLLARVVFTLLIALMTVEIHRMIPPKNRPHIVFAVPVALFVPLFFLFISFYPPYYSHRHLFLFLFVYFLIFLFGIAFCLRPAEHSWEKMSSLLFLCVYPGLLGSFFLILSEGFIYPHTIFFNEKPATQIHYILLTGLVYSCDGCAYLFGKFFGKRIFATKTPLLSVSPNKTILGFIGGIIGGMIFFCIVYAVNSTTFPGGLMKGLLFALLLCLASIAGDIFESIIKRSFHKKDSGTLMLGRGGVLDTFDSFLFAAPTYFIMFSLLYVLPHY